MSKVIHCKVCNSKNSFEAFTCSKCSAVLRTKVVNIDFWHTFYGLMFETRNTLRDIILSEHKNYLTLLIIVFSLKISHITFFLIRASDRIQNFLLAIEVFSILSVINIIVLLLLAMLIHTILVYSERTNFRRKNFFSLFFYSFSIFSLSIFILFILEMILFGSYFYSNNPSPFEIKEIPAYIITFLELFIFFISFIFLYIGLEIYTDKILIRTVLSIITIILLVGAIIFEAIILDKLIF